MLNSSPIDRREEVEQCDRIAAADFYRKHLERPNEVPVAQAMRAGEVDGSALIQAFKAHRLAERERCALDWLAGKTSLELHHHCPVYADDDDGAVEWRVTEVSGPINDREWTTVGRGATPIDALLDARATLTPTTGKDEGNG